MLTKGCAEGHAEHVGQGQSRKHQRDRLRAFAGGGEFAGDDAADAEKRAVTQGCDHARHHQQGVVRRQRTQEVAEGEQAQQPEQRFASIGFRGGHGEDRRADHHAEGVARHEQTGGGDVDVEVDGDLGQQPHDHKLRRADAKRGRSQRRKRLVVDGRSHRRRLSRSFSFVIAPVQAPSPSLPLPYRARDETSSALRAAPLWKRSGSKSERSTSSPLARERGRG